ncbi:MAG: extracellular solute-binding protein [Candidatus Tectomicrobia bacterium]|uniref:Extracellular solute-binding protein n=1 Tax=Tectimicrobiota bacterium TaxID=2528274 RepID=A0A932GMZ9_UNCTE|nr:extracellular solute-binding protein [Candidatus Tectomicrobia bacterium]
MMGRLVAFFACAVFAAGVPGFVEDAPAATAAKVSLQSVIDGARKEGVLEFYASAAMGPEGGRAIKDALNGKFRLNLDLKFTGSGSMTRDVAKVVTELSAGAPATWDIMVVNDAHYATLVNNEALDSVDWGGSFGIEPKAIFYNGLAVAVATQFVSPAYNNQRVKPADAPKRWEDLLDPKWKGKIGVSSATHHWARLAQVWGDEKTTKFVEALAKQSPALGRVPEVYTRLQLGETLVAATMVDDYIDQAKKTGAPVVFIDNPDPIIATHFLAAPLKRAKHRNAAILITAFLASPEGQAVWAKIMGQTSMYFQGTPAYQFAQKKNVVPLDYKFALTQLEDLSSKYGRLIGYR